jgi:hypothetical protein
LWVCTHSARPSLAVSRSLPLSFSLNSFGPLFSALFDVCHTSHAHPHTHARPTQVAKFGYDMSFFSLSLRSIIEIELIPLGTGYRRSWETKMNQAQLWVSARSTQRVRYWHFLFCLFFCLVSSCNLLFLALRLKHGVIPLQVIQRPDSTCCCSLTKSWDFIRNFFPALLVRDLSTASSLAYLGLSFYLWPEI